MRYFRDTENNPYQFDDNVTDTVIRTVEAKHNTMLTEVTEAEFKQMLEPTLDEFKAKKIQELYQAYEQANSEDIEYNGYMFQADKKSRELLGQVVAVGIVPEGFYWVSSDNVKVSMSIDGLKQLAGAMLIRGQVNFNKLQMLKEQVKEAATKEQINGIIWDGE